jgi:O-antigen/teichoic acid export membrane protein
MRAYVQKLKEKPGYSKAFEWIKLISMIGSVQVIVQGISFVSGILVVNMLPKGEYALYTLANTMLGTMVVLADGGISTGVMAHGAKVFMDRAKLGTVIVTGFDLRKKFAIGSIIIAIPVLLYLLRDNGASWTFSILIVGALLPGFFLSLTGNLLEIVAKVRQDIAPLQKIKVYTNVGRLALLSGFIFLFPYAYLAILAAAIPQLWANMKMRKNSEPYADLKQDIDIDPRIRLEILALVARILPGAIYFCVSGQITIWLISIFGSTNNIAEAGALGRLSMILSVFGVLFATLVMPRFARLTNDSHLLRNRFLQIIGAMFVLAFFIVGLVMLFPSQLLWVLGKNYSDLTTELILIIIGSSLAMIAGSTYSLYSNRGWAINPFISVPIGVLSIAVGVFLLQGELRVNTLSAILKLDIFVNSISIIMHVSYGLMKISKTRIPREQFPI